MADPREGPSQLALCVACGDPILDSDDRHWARGVTTYGVLRMWHAGREACEAAHADWLLMLEEASQ